MGDRISCQECLKRADAERELGLIVRRVVFRGQGKAFSESKQLVKTAGARENERSRVKDDVVGDTVRVRVGDEAPVGPIVREGRSEIEVDEPKIVPRFAPCVVQDDEGSARGDGVGEKIVGFAVDSVVRGDRW